MNTTFQLLTDIFIEIFKEQSTRQTHCIMNKTFLLLTDISKEENASSRKNTQFRAPTSLTRLQLLTDIFMEEHSWQSSRSNLQDRFGTFKHCKKPIVPGFQYKLCFVLL